MGKIYTSYFGNLHKIKDKGIVPISIAAFPPKWYAGAELKVLAPDVTMFIGYKENIVSQERFKKFYEHKLKVLGKEEILKKIKEIAGDKDAALLCFEAPGQFCHRRILGEFLEIEELK